jgi:hypothetical protein
MTVELLRDGNAIIATIGRDLQVGISGVGVTAPEALRDLAAAIERKRYPLPELDQRPGKPVLVKPDREASQDDPNDSDLLRDELKGQTVEHASPPRLEDEGQSGG